jgi:hypothetical protein
LDGLTFGKQAIENRLRQAAIPPRGGGNFAVPRSDFGETVAYCLLEERFGTRFGYKSIRDRELPRLPGRGIDAIGIEYTENGPLRLVLGETTALCKSNVTAFTA